MNLSFENIGDIKQASINFEKLTVISGENDDWKKYSWQAYVCNNPIL
jgi:hypothetical protein